MAKVTKKKAIVWQKHHITYDPEWVVKIRRSEHFYITRLQWFKSLSAGAKEALIFLIKSKPECKPEPKPECKPECKPADTEVKEE